MKDAMIETQNDADGSNKPKEERFAPTFGLPPIGKDHPQAAPYQEPSEAQRDSPTKTHTIHPKIGQHWKIELKIHGRLNPLEIKSAITEIEYTLMAEWWDRQSQTNSHLM